MDDKEEIAESEDLNPYFATVIGFVAPDGEIMEAPAQAQFNLLINVGEVDDVKVGERVLVFSLGQEVKDPQSNESLGHFEIVRGEGKVTSTQVRMAVITSTRAVMEQRQKPLPVISIASGLSREYDMVQVPAPFRAPQIG